MNFSSNRQTINPPPSNQWLLPLVGVLIAGMFALVCVTASKSWLLIATGVLAGAFFLFSAFRWPQALLAAAAFMPQWKGFWPLSQITFVDLTLVALAGLLLALSWRVLRHVGGLDRENLSEVFRGHGATLLAYAAFSSAVALSYAYTSAPNYGGAKLLRFVLIGTLLLVSGLLLIRNDRDFRRFALLFVACGCVTSIQMILHLQGRTANAEGDITRIGAGWLLGMSILLLLCFPLFEQPLRRMVFTIGSLPILIAGLIASAARGPAISLAVILPMTLFVFSKQRLSTARILIGLLIVACCGASYLYLKRADPEKYSSKASELVQLSRGGSASGSATKRLDFYRKTILAIPDNLWFGQGVGSWSFFYYGRDTRDYPHNLFLETTFEEGLVGQLLLLLFLGLVGGAVSRLLKRTSFRYGVLAGLLVYCVLISMFSGDLDDNRILWLWAGVALAVCRYTRARNAHHILIAQPRTGLAAPFLHLKPAERHSSRAIAHL
jgi:O-antigen ligase